MNVLEVAKLELWNEGNKAGDWARGKKRGEELECLSFGLLSCSFLTYGWRNNLKRL
jgi:hypothetical protein